MLQGIAGDARETGVIIVTDMGSFRIDIDLENPAQRGARVTVPQSLVDTGSELTCVPAPVLDALGVERRRLLRFRQATGAIVERWTGGAMIHAAGIATNDDVVFGEPGDLALLGARTLEGLNVVVDPVSRRLVDAGAMPAAAA